MRPRLSADTRWKLYGRLARWPGLSSALRARRYDKREYLRERLSLRNEREMLARVRGERDVCWLEGEDDVDPLVTVAIPTYQRPDTVGRAIQSAIDQTYTNLDVLVVGDRTDAATEEVVRSFADPRVRFVNLPYQGVYPEDPRLRGLVSGTKPMNVALDLAAGAWLANCDDDDELLPDHVERLLAEAKRRRLELVYSQSESIDHRTAPGPDGQPRSWITGSAPMRFATVTRGSAFYSMGLSFMRYEVESWRIRDPHDWNLWKRMQLIGVKIGFVEAITYRYHHGLPGAAIARTGIGPEGHLR
jgi:cellulose synthase/poly-beta-1,6-N-acetylglucosamine synthase-like glycosyltransferase